MRKKDLGALATPIVNPLFYVLTATSVLCAFLIAIRANKVEYVQYKFLLWNLFLAWLPLVASMTALAFIRVKKRGATLTVGLLVLGFAWLLLYPNAPYLTTDFIHLIFNDSYSYEDRQEDLLLWYDLVLFFLFSWCGLLLGYLSMRHFHSIVSYYLNEIVGWAFILVVSFLGGFGVYLGRVIRLNSWDVLNPLQLVKGIIEGINRRALIFTLLFGVLILIIYLSLYILGNNRTRYARENVFNG